MRTDQVRRIVELIAVGAVIASLAMLAWGPVPTPEHWKAAAFFTVFGLLAHGLLYPTSSATNGSIAFLPFLSVAVVAPNAAALATVLLSIVVTEAAARRAPIKAIFNIGQFVFCEAVAIAAYLLMGGTSILDGPPSVVAFLVMVTVWLSLNKLAVSTVVSAAEGKGTRAHWVRSMHLSVLYDIFAFPLIYLFAWVYDWGGMLVTTALALPMLGLRQQYKTNIALQKTNSELTQLSEELLQFQVANIEARDPYTSGHSQRVSRYARFIARTSGLKAAAVERIAVGALLHDVGKIYEEFGPILRKPTQLTPQEYEVMKSHPARGADLVSKVSRFADLVPMIRSHHEAWNGEGYPHGLAGADIPVGARIIALADTLDAMTTSRPYRSARSTREVREEFERESGSQFDPIICAALLARGSWAELEREVEQALGEYPVHATQQPRSTETASAANAANPTRSAT